MHLNPAKMKPEWMKKKLKINQITEYTTEIQTKISYPQDKLRDWK